MVRSLFVFSLLVAFSYAEIASVCDTCKMHVGTFVEASRNPSRMTLLQAQLRLLCSGTSHETDCAKVVSRLDFIARKLAPYMANTDAVCTRLQMCGSSDAPLSAIPRLAMLFFKQAQGRIQNDLLKEKEVCEECKMASRQIGDVLASPLTKHFVVETTNEHICKATGDHKASCGFFSSHALPKMIDQLSMIFGSAETVCADLKFCPAINYEPIVRPANSEKSLDEIWAQAGTIKTDDGEELMSCFECTVSVDALLEEMLTKRQGTADDLQKTVCGKVVANWTDGCNDFVHMYLSTVLYLTYNQFDGRAVCEKMHTCEVKGGETSIVPVTVEQRQLACANCKKMEQIFEKNSHELHFFASEAARTSVCSRLPVSFHTLCERMSINLSGNLLQSVSSLAQMGALCPTVC